MPEDNKTVVLVADDEPSTLALVSGHLRTRGYKVIEATDGDQAWELAYEHLPHVVVLDVMMPGMSGWEVCRKIREAVSLAHTGVVMLTGIGENLNEMTSPLYGADAYIDKPFDFRELDAKIRETLSSRRGGTLGRPDDADKQESGEPEPSMSNGAGAYPTEVALEEAAASDEDATSAASSSGDAEPPKRAARPAARKKAKAKAKKTASTSKKSAAKTKAKAKTKTKTKAKVARKAAKKTAAKANARAAKTKAKAAPKSAARAKAKVKPAARAKAVKRAGKTGAKAAATRPRADAARKSAAKPAATAKPRAKAKRASTGRSFIASATKPS